MDSWGNRFSDTYLYAYVYLPPHEPGLLRRSSASERQRRSRGSDRRRRSRNGNNKSRRSGDARKSRRTSTK